MEQEKPDIIINSDTSTGIPPMEPAREEGDDVLHKDVVMFVHFFVALIASSYIIAVAF